MNDAATISLIMNCYKRLDTKDCEQLSDEIDLVLSNSGTYGRITSLTIVNTPLRCFPRSVCRLTTLTHLHLNYNRLTRLPDNCLTNLSNLIQFSAHDSTIETLQDGVFQGLTKLENLDLRRNRIGSIGLSVFGQSSRLNSLFNILLSRNNLTSLEPWVIVRGLIGSFQRIVQIDLSHNAISKFTNKMGLTGCRGPTNSVPFANIFLQYNNIEHYTDLFRGWKVDVKQIALSCYSFSGGRSNLALIYYGNNIACDCVDYYFFKDSFLQQVEDYLQPMECMLTDPLRRNSSLVNGFKTPLELFVCELTERCPAECVCVHRPSNATLHIYCSNKNLSVLPAELPELPDDRTKYKLDFSNNRLVRLEDRYYFANTSILDISNCGVVSVSNWEEIINLPDVNLYGNKIASLPPSLLSANISTGGKLNIANNPWDCSCDNKWMSRWLASMGNRLTQKVLCFSPDRLNGKSIVQVSSEEFCVDPASEAASKAVKRALTISMSSVAGGVVVLLILVVSVYRLRVRLYTRWKFHPFDRDECLGEDMKYDVFLSSSSDDNLPHGDRIRQKLEQRKYRVCYPPRDFVAGDTIYNNIYNAVVRSKRTICLLTPHFIERFASFYLILCLVMILNNQLCLM